MRGKTVAEVRILYRLRRRNSLAKTTITTPKQVREAKDRRALSDFIETAALRFFDDEQYADEFEMIKMEGNDESNESMNREHGAIESENSDFSTRSMRKKRSYFFLPLTIGGPLTGNSLEPKRHDKMKRFAILLLAHLLVAPFAFPGEDEEGKTSFMVGIEMPSQIPVTPAVEAALRHIGIQYINYYVKPWNGTPIETSLSTNEGMLAFCDKMDIPFSLACYVVDPPDACVQEAVKRGKRFKGILFDELAHCRQLNPHEGIETFTDTESLSDLQDAYERTLQGYEALREQYAALETDCVATHVFPVLHHVSARAGFTVCPKIQKEFYSTVSLAIAMGAALQYEKDLWVDCDLWYYALVPGHPPEELWCNLLLAYWLGADCLYLEGCGHNLTPAGAQGIPFSLMTQVTEDRYQLTAHGETLRRFIQEYLPKHPRPWTFRDVKPSIAIVRFPDSDYGQWFQYVSDPDRPADKKEWHAGLYGSPNLPSTEDTRAWFGLWNLLTFGTTGHDGISHFKCTVAASGYQGKTVDKQIESLHSRSLLAATHPFFVPMNNVVVFDHLVSYDRLAKIPLLFLTGVEISRETMDAVRRCAEEGASVVVWGPLAKKLGFPAPQGGVKEIPASKGKFIITNSFSLNGVFQKVWMHLGHPDEIKYRFGEQTVLLKKVTENQVEVKIAN